MSKQEFKIKENELLDMPNALYHAQTHYIGASQIKTLLKNPYEFFHPSYKEPSDAMIMGSVVHSLVLEPDKFTEDFAVAPQVDKRTKEGKYTWQKFTIENEAKQVISSDTYDKAIEIQQSVFQVDEVSKLIKGGVAEKSLFKTLECGTKVKVRPDMYRDDIKLIIDLKTCRDASPDDFKKDIANFKYYIQAAHYIDTLGAKEFVFLAVEKEPPYMVGLYTLTAEDLDRGRELIQKAYSISRYPEKYQKPLYKDKGGNAVQTLVLPNYIHYESEN